MTGFLYQTGLNGFLSVDTFFFLGGFLMSYSIFREFERSGRFNIFMFYFHRIIRLVPPIMLTAGLYATVAKFFVQGQLANLWNNLRNTCQSKWWMDAVFYDNFAIRNGESVCLGQCWYLAVDSQLYLIAPLIFLPIMYNRKIGMVWLYIATMASILIPSIQTYVDDYPPTMILLDPKDKEYFFNNYVMPWCRAGPIYVGIWLGLFIQKQGNRKIKLEWWQVVIGWTVAALTGLMVVYGLWSYNVIPRKAHYDMMTAVLYGGFHRPAWGAALAWVVFACYNGYGGFVNDFLSHPVWQPISRLTYSTYLVALSLQVIVIDNARVPYYFAHYSKTLETVGAIVLAIIPAILVSITAESPIIGLEKLLFRSSGRGERNKRDKSALEGKDNKGYDEMEELHEMETKGCETQVANGIHASKAVEGEKPPDQELVTYL